tara:strand:- start:220 stop:594 length:375 start_codon:yes stop_codon:yes gene_type:complete
MTEIEADEIVKENKPLEGVKWAIVLFILFTCILPFGFGNQILEYGYKYYMFGSKSLTIIIDFVIWWLIRCISSLILITFFHDGIKNKLMAICSTVCILIAVSVVFIPVYTFAALFFAFWGASPL